MWECTLHGPDGGLAQVVLRRANVRKLQVDQRHALDSMALCIVALDGRSASPATGGEAGGGRGSGPVLDVVIVRVAVIENDPARRG